jgi:hypothetical protein
MFNKVLRVIGTSGNRDGEEIGQFGMGFISYALLTDALILETWSRENNEHYAMLCDSGLKFKPVPLDTSNDIENMSNYGTKLTMTCNHDVSFSEAVEQLRELARFSQIPTKIIILDDIVAETYRTQDWNKGIIECESYKDGMDYLKQTTKTIQRYKENQATDDTKVVFYDEITIDCDDYRFDGIIAVTKSRYGSLGLVDRHSGVPVLLAGTAVESQLRAQGFMATIINVKDERKFSPVASRDALESNAIDDLNDRLKQDLKEHFMKYNMKDISEYNASLYKPLVSRNVMWELEDYLSEEMLNISRTLNSRYATPDGNSTLSDMIATGSTIICLKSLRTDLMNALKDEFDGTVQFFRLSTKMNGESRAHRIDLFKQLNIIMGEDYKKEHSIKEKRTVTVKADGTKATFNEDRAVVLYNCNKGTNNPDLYGNRTGWRAGSEKYSTTIGNVNDEVHPYMVTASTKQFLKVISILNTHVNDWKVMHDMKGLSEDIITFDKLMVSVADRYYQTQDGMVKGSELNGKYYIIVTPECTELLDGVNALRGYHEDHERKFIAVEDVNDAVELMWYEYLNTERLTIELDVYGRCLERSIFADQEESLKFHDHDYDKNERSAPIIRCYWINELLPKKYADVFIDAIQNNVEKIDSIEAQARELNEVLKQ